MDLEDARSLWHWRGQQRQAFAVAPAPGQQSVWDLPRPAALAADPREGVIR